MYKVWCRKTKACGVLQSAQERHKQQSLLTDVLERVINTHTDEKTNSTSIYQLPFKKEKGSETF